MVRASRPWRWIVCAFVVAGLSVSLAAPGHNEPYDAIIRRSSSSPLGGGRAQPGPAGEPDRGREPGRPGRSGNGRQSSRAAAAGAATDRARTARCRGASRQPDGGPGGGGGVAAAGPARRRPCGPWTSSATRPGGPDRTAPASGRPARPRPNTWKHPRRPPSGNLAGYSTRSRRGPARRFHGRGHSRPDRARSRPDRLPDRSGGADQHHPARPRRSASVTCHLRAGVRHRVRHRLRAPAAGEREDRGRPPGWQTAGLAEAATG